jgi:Protein of unknown function (DUF3631)
VTWEEIKAKADRAEARAQGKTEAQAFVAAALTEGEINVEIKKLAALPASVYESERVSAAKRLGWRTSILDDLVTSARPRSKEDGEATMPHWHVEPWKNEVSTGELLDAIVRVFSRHIVLPKYAAEAIALWILHAWAFDAWDISPFLLLTSPTKRCGKTTALILLNWLAPRAVIAGNISASAIFRYIEDQRPSLLIDEADSFLKFSEEIRGILDAGHTKVAANTVRNVEINGQHVPKCFSTWAPKAIAGIGRFAGTIEDRSIIVSLQRKPKTARVQRCRHRDTAEFIELRQKCLRWATDNLHKLAGAEPGLPNALNDRAADNWEPLLAIAELAGDAWANKARAAALALAGDDDGDDLGVDLLHDARAAFAAVGDQGIFSRELVAALASDPERPWATYGKNEKPITDRQVAKLLGPFGIASTTIHRPSGAHAKGYRFEDFLAAWESYPAPSAPSKSGQSLSAPSEGARACERASTDGTGTSAIFARVRETNPHAHEKCDLFNNDAGSHARTLRNPESGPEGFSATPREANEAEGTRHENGARCAAAVAGVADFSEGVCEHSGGPGELVPDFHYGDANPRLHGACIDPWAANYDATTDDTTTDDTTDDTTTDDLTIPPYLDRRGELQ